MKYSMYVIVAIKDEDNICKFKVRAASHTQEKYVLSSTYLNGLSISGKKKIHELKEAGYRITATIAGRHGVFVEN